MEHKNSSCSFTDVYTWTYCFNMLTDSPCRGAGGRSCQPSRILHERKLLLPQCQIQVYFHRVQSAAHPYTDKHTSLRPAAFLLSSTVHTAGPLNSELLSEPLKVHIHPHHFFYKGRTLILFKFPYVDLNPCNGRKYNVYAPYLSKTGLSYH